MSDRSGLRVMRGYIATSLHGRVLWDTLQPYAQGCRDMAGTLFHGGWSEAYRQGFRVVAVDVVRRP